MNPHFTEAWRAVATAKIDEFAFQCERLAGLAHDGDVNVSEAASCLQEIAEANCLCSTFGADYIVSMIAWPFAHPICEEAAA